MSLVRSTPHPDKHMSGTQRRQTVVSAGWGTGVFGARLHAGAPSRETSQRRGAVVEGVGDRLFVWGGASVTRDISQGYSSADGDPWHVHDDGAVLTLD